MDVLFRVISCDFVDRFTASIATHHFFSNLLGFMLSLRFAGPTSNLFSHSAGLPIFNAPW
jgi:hypothetical protein